MKSAITDFQKMWGGTADCTVDPHGQTLKRLDRLANPLVVKQITKDLVSNGGYRIVFASCDGGPLPPAGNGYTVHLCFFDDKNSIEVSNRPAHSLLNKDNLGAVLDIFEKLNFWAKYAPGRAGEGCTPAGEADQRWREAHAKELGVPSLRRRLRPLCWAPPSRRKTVC